MNSLSAEIITELTAIVGAERLFIDEEVRKEYGHDYTEDLSFPPAVVLKPQSVDEVSAIMKLASARLIPVTPIGARTGLSGGALSIKGGIGLSMERFNRILHIDENNLQATLEPGVITQVFQEAVKEKGLMYPPDP
ncbi:MAG: FAD-binding oxidoreductase, partial [Salibacteraceae bacterium]|nr:FAD-binding oxidoreductase [Salibacteraceae bacterium]